MEIETELAKNETKQTMPKQLARSNSESVTKSKRMQRSASEGGKPRAPSLGKTSRQSSTSSTMEVRCACQFYMSDSLLPERVNPVGTAPPVKMEFMAHRIMG